MSVQKISAQGFSQILSGKEPVFVLDVRTDIECRAIRLNGSFVHIPLQDLEPDKFAKDYALAISDKPIYILCRSGGRAARAAEALSPYFKDIFIVEGGLDACCTCGVPVTRQEILSLERQVRIAAGFLVLFGVISGHFINNNFYILSGAVGGGLIFAGVTNWCGMAMLLARAPWNKQ